jgi:hypothetical protein
LGLVNWVGAGCEGVRSTPNMFFMFASWSLEEVEAWEVLRAELGWVGWRLSGAVGCYLGGY